MILNGKDLFMYRFNQIKNFVSMLAVTGMAVASMMYMVVAFG